MDRLDMVKEIEVMGAEVALALQSGYTETYLLQCQQNPGSIGYAEAPTDFENCKGISCDVAGVVRIATQKEASGDIKIEVLQLNAGSIRPVRNVKRLYYNATTLTTTPTRGTAQSYAENGSLYQNAIKLHR